MIVLKIRVLNRSRLNWKNYSKRFQYIYNKRIVKKDSSKTRIRVLCYAHITFSMKNFQNLLLSSGAHIREYGSWPSRGTRAVQCLIRQSIYTSSLSEYNSLEVSIQRYTFTVRNMMHCIDIFIWYDILIQINKHTYKFDTDKS